MDKLSENSIELIDDSLKKLLNYIEKEDFRGWDPYDFLNSWVPFKWGGKWVQAIAVQAGKLIPFNLRRILGIKKQDIPKGLGLLLNAYCLLYEKTKDKSFLETAEKLFNRLIEARSESEEYCWGCNFVWANPHKVLPRYFPSVVVTSFAGFGIFRYFNITRDERAKEILLSIGRYIHNNTKWTQTESGLCMGYTSQSDEYCYNASILGALMLSEIYKVEGSAVLLDEIRELVRFVVSSQHSDGHWAYSYYPDKGKEYEQIDFHQGFILVSLKRIKDLTGVDFPGLNEAVAKGLEYYRRVQFTDEGVSLWRVPKARPVEIHNQAQGIITFSLFSGLDEEYAPFARKILLWTIANMRSGKGFFYYRKFRHYTVRIPYMRWSQAWMLLAMVYYKCEV